MPASSTVRLQGRRFATELFGFDETSAAYIQARFEASRGQGRQPERAGSVRAGRRSATDAGIETAIGRHTFRATGITDYLTNGGRIEVAQRMAGHANAETTGLYDRRNDDVSVGEVERIGI